MPKTAFTGAHLRAPGSPLVGGRLRAPRAAGKGGGITEPTERFLVQEPTGVIPFGKRQRPIAEPQWSARILLVDADPAALRRVDARLSGQGYGVAAVSSLEAAKARFDAVDPDLVVAAIRLRAFNGLHLAAWLRNNHPNLPIIITHTSFDPVLARDAQRLGAIFVVQPLEGPEFLQHVRESVGDPPPE
jgi:CheY-like chemotaxis protein